jgi:transcriptional regulator GlxA family with amidase domain
MKTGSAPDVPHRFLVVGYDGAELLEIASITTTLVAANRLAEKELYSWAVITPGGRPITCDSGLILRADASLQSVTGPADTLIVSGGFAYERAASDPTLVAHVRRLAETSGRIASVCSGAALLAEAGLLDGRRAATHWMACDDLARRSPSVHFDPDPIYLRDGDVWTSAGVTSALDLTLAMVEEDFGVHLARQVARALVTFMQRPGNQAQVSMFVSAEPPENPVLRAAVDFIGSHLADPLETGLVAEEVGVSDRQLHRLFVEHLQSTPGRYIRRSRTEAAARLLSTSSLPVSAVARECGFGTPETLRQAFTQHYRISPARYRQAHRHLEAG